MLLQVLGENFHPIIFRIQKAIASFGGNFCKFWGARKINGSGLLQVLGENFYPIKFLVSWFKKLLQDLGESFSPMKSKQLSYCKIWGAFKINGSEAIASFGEPVKSTVPGYCKFWGELLQVLGSP